MTEIDWWGGWIDGWMEGRRDGGMDGGMERRSLFMQDNEYN